MNYCCIIVAIKSLCVKLMQSFILICIYLDRIILIIIIIIITNFYTGLKNPSVCNTVVLGVYVPVFFFQV